MNKPPRKISAARSGSSVRRQSGYATILGAILMTAMVLSIFSLYDVGQVTTHKMRGQNAADAGAFSVATVVARDMNFIATTNRAMVANQVAIGQMVGLSSYGHMIEQTAFNFNVVAQFANLIPGGQIVARIADALRQGARAMKQAFDAAARVFVPINDNIIGVLSGTQAVFHAAMLASSQQVYNDVVKKNDPDIDSSFVVGAFTVTNFINEYRRKMEWNDGPRAFGGGRKGQLHRKRFDEFQQVVIGSQDRFLRSRDASFLGVIRERGGNEFRKRRQGNKYVWEWTAMDTMRIKIPPCFFGCLLKVPLGWGAGHALYNGRSYNYQRRRGRWGNAWSNRTAANIARVDDRRNNVADRPTKSLQPFYDLEEDGLRERGPAMLAVVKKPIKPVRVWKEVAKDTANYQLQDRFDVAKDGSIARDQIISLAKAEPYFSRPADLWARRDRKLEYGNMYNPFWQPRLTEATDAERSSVMFAAAGLRL